MFGMLGIFSEFEREMIVARVNAGLTRAKEKIARDGKFTSKAGKVRTRLGRPGAKPEQIEAARGHLIAGVGIGRAARLTGLGTGTVHKLAREMRSAASA
jgi:DNA invertase Pin-like site-specific DNA recombinase